MNKLYLLVLLILFASCEKDALLNPIETLNPENKIYSFGHGGMGDRSLHQINSFESLTAALDLNPTGVEMDVQLSADNKIILFHDTYLPDGSIICQQAGDHATGQKYETLFKEQVVSAEYSNGANKNV